MPNDEAPSSERDHLLRQQKALADCLVNDAQIPPGFDHSRVRLAADMLRSKRRGNVAKFAPMLVHELGTDFGKLFEQYATRNLLTGHGAREDAISFARFVRKHGSEAQQCAARRWRSSTKGWRYLLFRFFRRQP